MVKKPTYFVFIVALVFFGNIKAIAQISNNGVKLFLDKKAVLYVTGNYLHRDGQVLNNGTITILGDWDSYNEVFEEGSKGTVVFDSNKANLNGTAAFPKLVFKGNGSYFLKGKFDARLSLDIEDAEISLTGEEALRLLNPSINALVRNTGYINTGDGFEGSFVRNTDMDGDYLYPLGTKSLKRFVVLSPKTASLNAFAVSFIDKDPNTGGFSRASKAKSVTEINDTYYHKIKRLNGTSAVDVSFLIPVSEKYTSLVSWVKNMQWDRAFSTSSSDKSALAPYLSQIVLHKNADLSLGSDVGFALAQTANNGPFEFYNAFSPDGDGKNDTWEVKNIDIFPDNDLKIFDRSGNLVYRMNGYNSSKYWDGQNVPSGTYIYILRVKIDGQDQHFKGSITMVKK